MKYICVADDDEGIRESFRFLFDEAGYAIEEAVDGKAVLDLLQHNPVPRVLVLDRMMPRLDGFAVLQALAGLPDVLARTAVVFCTARSDRASEEQAQLLASTTVAVVQKPFLLETLQEAMNQAWESLGDQVDLPRQPPSHDRLVGS